ncbi:MAG: polysaccharide deacetylase family protein, partial [Candidatus Omnitrophica bacterium]|nr:polysaccharide deacetylase family protein [Candidatus Omnitrophota bacterium]
RIFEEGHEIASHSQIHQNAWKTMPWTSYKDVSQGYQTLEKWMPENGLFRPPHGKLSISSWAALRRRKAKVGWWTIDSGDTYPSPPDSMAAAETLKKRGGGVVLLHDFDRTRNERHDFVIQATNFLLKTIEEEGLSPKKLGDILANTDNRT